MSKKSAKREKPAKPSEQLRQIIATCGMTRYELSKQSGVEQAVLSRFVNGTRGLNTETIDRLAAVLGIEWHVAKKGRE